MYYVEAQMALHIMFFHINVEKHIIRLTKFFPSVWTRKLLDHGLSTLKLSSIIYYRYSSNSIINRAVKQGYNIYLSTNLLFTI
jgi:hypothetical protein